MSDREAERDEMARMLLWFKGTLPAHDVARWYIQATLMPIPIVVEDENPRVVHLGNRTGREFRVSGYGRCARCGQVFAIPNIGNAVAMDESHIYGVVDRMKDWVRRDAAKADPCWGDVPKLPDPPAHLLDH